MKLGNRALVRVWMLAGLWSCSGARAPAEPAQNAVTPQISTTPTPSASPAASSAPAAAQPATNAEHGPATLPAVGSALAQAPHVAAPSTTNDGSCPADMQLVAGDYCSDVEFHCLKSWYDEPNKKTVCEDFEPTSKCVGSKSPKRFCIDRYAWPNVKDERPEVMNNFYQAQVKCAAVGKRLCTESEWTMACEGPEMKPFPYGYKRDVNKCNGDQPWDKPDMSKVRDRDPDELARLWHGVRNGQQPQCVSDYGVADLAGNTDDVVSNEETKGEYNSLCTGGPWYKGVRNQCRPKIYTHDEGFYYYYLSFRCCAESDGQTSDPRTPRQKKKNEDFKSVERLARFSVDQMKQKLELKKQGQCTCAAKDILCKTMCGTLLGPGAKDVVLSPSKP